MISGRNHDQKFRYRILAKALEINRRRKANGPADRLRPVGAPGAKAKVGVVCRVTFGDALAQSNAAVTTNKAVIKVSVSWRIVFI